jgi:hypothetical protein
MDHNHMQALVLSGRASNLNVPLSQNIYFEGKSDACSIVHCTGPIELDFGIHKENCLETMMMMMSLLWYRMYNV